MIKKHLLRMAIVASVLMGAQMAGAQTTGMGINTTGAAANSSAMLDVASTASPFKGMLIPRMSNTNMNSITVNASNIGLMVYNTTLAGFYYWNGSAWVQIGDGAGTGTAGGDLTGNYPNPTISSSASTGNNIVTAINASTGGLNGTKLATNSVSVNALSATGTPSSTTFLRGDNTWATPAGAANGTAAGQIAITGASPFAQQTPQTVTGDVTITSGAVTSIANNATAGNHIVTALGSANSGTIPAARLGTSSGSSTTFLNGSGAFSTPTSSTNYVFAGLISEPNNVTGNANWPDGHLINSAGLTPIGTVPTSMTLTTFNWVAYIKSSSVSGTNVHVLTLYKNGSPTTITATITTNAEANGTTFSGTLTGLSVSLTTSDRLYWLVTQSLAAGAEVYWGISVLGN